MILFIIENFMASEFAQQYSQLFQDDVGELPFENLPQRMEQYQNARMDRNI